MNPTTQTYTVTLSDLDLGQVIDGLESRAESWERTAEYHNTGSTDGDIEECDDAEEAEKIAGHYRRIIRSLVTQRDAARVAITKATR